MNIGFDEETAVEEFIIPIRDKNQVVKARYALKDTDIEKNALMSEHYIEISFALDISLSLCVQIISSGKAKSISSRKIIRPMR